jgi:hypothetical protein
MLWRLNFRRDKLEQRITEFPLQKRLSLPRARVAAIPALIAYFAGCSTVDQKYGDQAWYQKSKQASSKAIDVTTTTATKAVEVTSTTASKAYTRMQQYLAEKDVLKTFYDAGEHSEAAAPSGDAPRTPKHAPAPPPLSTVPEQYAGSMRWPLDAYIVSFTARSKNQFAVCAQHRSFHGSSRAFRNSRRGCGGQSPQRAAQIQTRPVGRYGRHPLASIR